MSLAFVASVARLLSQLKRAGTPNPDQFLSTSIVQLCDAAQHTAMSTPQTPLEHQHITPPSSFADAPLTPPPTDEKAFTQAPRVITLFKDIEAGRLIKQHP